MAHVLPRAPKIMVSASMRFSFSRVNSHIINMIKNFHDNVIPQLLYGAQICPSKHFHFLEAIQLKFLRSLFGIPCCISNTLLIIHAVFSNARLRVELETVSLEIPSC